MNEYAMGALPDPRMSRMKYRIMFRNRYGLQGREAMIVCVNFRITLDERFVYTNLKGELKILPLRRGDYFEVKVLG